MCRYDPVAYRQPEPKSERLGRIEWLEHPPLHLGRNANALVGHRDADEISRMPRCPDDQQTGGNWLIAHRLTPIGDEIEDDLPKLHPVSLNGRNAVVELLHNGNVSQQKVTSTQLQGGGNQLVNIEWLC